MPQIIGINKSGSPIGTIKSFSGTSAPQNFLLCYGQAISRTTYAALFAIIGTTYGVGDGSTTFNLPDLRGRTLAGKDNMGGSAAGRLTSGGSGVDGVTLGATGGAETHTLTTSQLATHSHANTLNDPGHTHKLSYNNGGVGFNLNPGLNHYRLNYINDGSVNDELQNDTRTTGISINNVNAGSNNAHNNTQPTIIMNYIIAYI